MLVGVTGANGFVGSHLVEALLAGGHSVRVLVRENSNLKWIKDRAAEKVYGEIRNTASIVPFVEDLDVLVHCAGVTAAPTLDILTETNVQGTLNLLKAVSAHNPRLKRFVYISSQEAAGVNDSLQSSLEETAALKPITDYGRTKAKAEKLVCEFGHNIPFTIIRPSPVYGPRDKDTYLLFKAVALGIRPIATFPNRFSLVCVTNLADAIVGAMSSVNTVGKIYYISDDSDVSYHEIIRAIVSVLGKPRFPFPVSKLLLFAISYTATAFSFVTSKRSILNKQKYKMLTAPNLRVNVSAAKSDFGYTPRFDTMTGLKQAAVWYKEHDWV